ncbi:condensation domain-containing protein [Loktanella sp. S4079]|uniref:condensation domain-containing protein n=1 Tax=Loktanella sp. S4079 TaxID=579483 RepID=UPI0006987D06|nr:condensation domain-containing protein [Loktanella sp. S4079]
MTSHNPLPDTQIGVRPATDTETGIWFEHHQTENGLAPLVDLVALPDGTEAGEIANTFVGLVAANPELARTYQFDDAGELWVQPAKTTNGLHIRWAADPADAGKVASEIAAKPWDLATQGPVSLGVILSGKTVHLALIRHPIAAELIDGKTLFAQLAPQATAVATQTQNDPITQTILNEFQLALDAPDMIADSDFFDFGGHSLVATRVIGRLASKHGIELRFNDLFAHATAASLAKIAHYEAPETDQPADDWAAVTPGALPEKYETRSRIPLSLAQASLWKIYAALGFGPMFNIPFVLRFLDPVDETIFAAAFRDILERHPALRSRFYADGDTVEQECVPMAEVDQLQWFWPSEAVQDPNPILAKEAGYTFDLATELPIRLRFIQGEDGQLLSFLFHHIVLDEWSVNLMMDDLARAYAARAIGQAPTWDQPIAPFHAFARKQSEAGFDQAALDYWTDALKNASDPRPIRAADAAPLAVSESHAADGGWTEIALEQSVTDALYRLSKDCSASLFNTVYAAISVALQRLAGLDDLTIGTSASGRTDPDYFDTVGYFTTVTAHSLRAPDHLTPRELIGNVRDMINGSLPYCEIPIDLVEEALTNGQAPLGEHMFEVFIQIHAQNKLNGTLEGPDQTIRFRQVDPDKNESVLGLQFEVVEDVIEGQKQLRVMMSYRTAHYGPEDVTALTRAVQNSCAAFAGQDAVDRPLAQLLP